MELVLVELASSHPQLLLPVYQLANAYTHHPHLRRWREHVGLLTGTAAFAVAVVGPLLLLHKTQQAWYRRLPALPWGSQAGSHSGSGIGVLSGSVQGVGDHRPGSAMIELEGTGIAQEDTHTLAYLELVKKTSEKNLLAHVTPAMTNRWILKLSTTK